MCTLELVFGSVSCISNVMKKHWYFYLAFFCSYTVSDLLGLFCAFPFLFFSNFFSPCHISCRIFVPAPVIEAGSQQRQTQVLTTGLPGNSLCILIIAKDIQPEEIALFSNFFPFSSVSFTLLPFFSQIYWDL